MDPKTILGFGAGFNAAKVQDSASEEVEVKVKKKMSKTVGFGKGIGAGAAARLLGRMSGRGKTLNRSHQKPAPPPPKPTDVTSAELHAVKWVVLRETYLDRLKSITEGMGETQVGKKR
jgi:hypothetical protein